jgi:Zn-dependent protease
MRTLRLAQSAVSAEGLRLRLMLRRWIFHLILALLGMVFLLGALALGHVAVFLLIAPKVGPLYAVLILLAADLVIAILLLLLAFNGGPGKSEREALQVREMARLQAIQDIARATLILPTIRLLIRLASQYIGSRRR